MPYSLFDATGKGEVLGHTIKELAWDVINGEPMPSWLEIVGEHTLELLDVSVSRGVAKVTIPSDETAVIIRPTFDIGTGYFSELGFFVFGLTCQNEKQSQEMWWGDSANGAAMYRELYSNEHYARIYPTGEAHRLDYAWTNIGGNNSSNSKNLGIVLRPELKQAWFTQGDHTQGDKEVWFEMGGWVDGIMRPSLQLKTRKDDTQQRSVAFSKITLRLAHW